MEGMIGLIGKLGRNVDRGGCGFSGDWRFGLNLLGILGILSFKIWRFGDFGKSGDGDFSI